MNLTLFPSKLAGEIAAIPSKSAAHRYLICASFADGESRLELPSSSKDIDATISCLNSLGADISYDGNTVVVKPIRNIPCDPELHCGESGSTLRFLAPVVGALGGGTFIMEGRLPNRPMDDLNAAMEAHGVAASQDGARMTYSGYMRGGDFFISGNVSSQYITGLLLALPLCGGGTVDLTTPLQSSPYVDITIDAMRSFGVDVIKGEDSFTVKEGAKYRVNDLRIPSDWSNAAFWLACGVSVTGLEPDSAQGDKEFCRILTRMGAKETWRDGALSFSIGDLKPCEVDASEIPDLVPIISIMCALANGTSVIHNTARLRAKESDRVASVCEMLTALGVSVSADDNTITVMGKGHIPHGGEIDSHNDHRIAMSAAAASHYAPSPITVLGAEAVEKSYPRFWNDYNKLGGLTNVQYDRR